MDYLTNYVKPELLVLIPVLYLVGSAVKQSESLKDKIIPLLLGLVGVLLSTVYVFATSPVGTMQDILMAVFISVTQGILCAGASVYVNQIIKQAAKSE